MNVSSVPSATHPHLDLLQSNSTQNQPKVRGDHDGDADDSAGAAAATAAGQPEATEGSMLNTLA